MSVIVVRKKREKYNAAQELPPSLIPNFPASMGDVEYNRMLNSRYIFWLIRLSALSPSLLALYKELFSKLGSILNRQRILEIMQAQPEIKNRLSINAALTRMRTLLSNDPDIVTRMGLRYTLALEFSPTSPLADIRNLDTAIPYQDVVLDVKQLTYRNETIPISGLVYRLLLIFFLHPEKPLHEEDIAQYMFGKFEPEIMFSMRSALYKARKELERVNLLIIRIPNRRHMLRLVPLPIR
ncbi:hypothetical protein [Chitinophaga sp. YIM B06452]|uniref:hypothetical protein n=1 Tax=Chitinophaga sp. YIM B06452 TaxID=3082158 RepID=UPI0031FE7DDC